MKAVFAIFLFFTMSLFAAAAESVVHVVHFKFKADADPKLVKKVETEFFSLKEKISEIQSFEWGTNSSPEGLSDGFTHCWILRFKDEKARDAYIAHPDHKAFVAMLKGSGVLEKPFVVDFIPQK